MVPLYVGSMAGAKSFFYISGIISSGRKVRKLHVAGGIVKAKLRFKRSAHVHIVGTYRLGQLPLAALSPGVDRARAIRNNLPQIILMSHHLAFHGRGVHRLVVVQRTTHNILSIVSEGP